MSREWTIDKVGMDSSGQPLIELSGVKKAYHTPAGDFYALRGVDLTIRTGEFVALSGRSGAGKSTLINLVSGIDRATVSYTHLTLPTSDLV